MTNEEFEKRMDFIVEQQAQFAADMQRLQESQAQSEQLVVRLINVTHAGFQELTAGLNAVVDSHVRLTDAQTTLTDAQTKLTEAQSRTDDELKNLSAKMDALVDSQIRLTDAHTRLSESQDRTDEALRNLAALVDRYLREGRNGESRH